MDKAIDKLAEKIEKIDTVEEGKKEKVNIIEMIKLYFYNKLEAGFENTHEKETHISKNLEFRMPPL